MAALEDTGEALRSTNCQGCDESRVAELTIESTASRQPTEHQLAEIKELREELIRLKSEFSVCKHVTEDLLKEMRQLSASAEKAKDELSRELEGSKQATKLHLEELKELRESAEKDKDELRRELQGSKQAIKRHLGELEELKALSSRKEHSEQKENMDPSEHQPLFKKPKGFFGSTKSKKKKKRKKHLSDECKVEEPKTPPNSKASSEMESNLDEELWDSQATRRKQIRRQAQNASADHGDYAAWDKNRGRVSQSSSFAQNASADHGDYADWDKCSARVSQSSSFVENVKTLYEERRSSGQNNVNVLLQHHRSLVDWRSGSRSSLACRRTSSYGRQDYEEVHSAFPDWRRGSRSSLARTSSCGQQDYDDVHSAFPVRYHPRRHDSSKSLPSQLPRLYSLYSQEDTDSDRDSDRDTAITQCPIKIIKEPASSQEAKEGSNVELVLRCRAEGISKLFYQWFKDDTELQGKNKNVLVLKSVTLPDFGCYKCRVGYKDSPSDFVESSTADVDVTPSDGTRYKYLNEIDPNTQDTVGTLLTQKRHSLGGWKQIAFKYGMDQLNIKLLQDDQEAGRKTLEYLDSSNPYLTVYDFCKTLKERSIRRLDVVKELLGHLSISSSNVFV